MHILQILPELNQGGVERGAIEINREFVKRGHRSTVISAGGSQTDQIKKDGGEHICLDVCSKNPLTFCSRVLQLKKVLKELNPDIVHARSRVPAWLTWFANKQLKVPFVTTVHGFNSVSKYSEVMLKGALVIYGSTSIKQYILENYPIDESKLRYVPRGIDMEYFDPNSIDEEFIQRFKAEHQLEGRTVLTIVGRITEWKGHDCFIRALAAVQKTNPSVIGVVAGGVWHGKEDYLAELKTLAEEVSAEIRFTGSQSQIREVYALSDFVISAASKNTAHETEALASSLDSNMGVYLVPAFTGLGAPHWDPDARGAIFGITRDTGVAELVRATLESVCYQTFDLLEAKRRDGLEPTRLRVDGGMVQNDWLCGFLADMLDIIVERPVETETTALGAAYLAGLQVGLFASLEDISARWQAEREFDPTMDSHQRNLLLADWHEAIIKVKTGESPG